MLRTIGEGEAVWRVRALVGAAAAACAVLLMSQAGCGGACLSTAELTARQQTLASEEQAAIQKAFAANGWRPVTVTPLSTGGMSQADGDDAGGGWRLIRSPDAPAASTELALVQWSSYGPRDYVVQARDGRYFTVSIEKKIVSTERVLWCECDPGQGIEQAPMPFAVMIPSRAAYAGHQVLTIESRNLVVDEKKHTPGVCHAAP